MSRARPARRLRSVPAVAAVVLAGCGPLVVEPSDAAGTDGGGVDGALIGAIEVTVSTGDVADTPAIGATVVFLGPDGAELDTQATDGNGHASATVPLGASVTVVRVRADGADLTTILGVAPGDDLAFGALREDAGIPRGPMSFPYTAYGGMPAATGYGFYTACTTYTPVLVGPNLPHPELDSRCPGTFEMLLVAFGTQPTRYVYAPAVPFSDGGAYTFPNTWTPMTELSVSYTQTPFDILSELRTTAGPVLDGRVRFAPGITTDPIAANHAVTLHVPQIGEGIQVATTLRRGEVQGSQLVVTRGVLSTSYGINLGDAMLPWLSAPIFDVGSATVTWTRDGSGADAAVVVDASYARSSGGQSYTWRVIAPGGATQIALPTLPASVGDLGPALGDSTSATVRLLGFDGGRAYADVRGEVDRHVDGGAEPWLRDTGATRVTISQWQAPAFR
ncbi:MAG: hypothetical protein R2939_08175 [Kofleriaceae bacterium]